METIKLIVDGNRIRRDPNSERIYIPSNGVVVAEFFFSPDWVDYSTKVVGFCDRDGVEHTPQRLLNGATTCEIPDGVLNRPIFYIQIIGASTSDLTFRYTDKCAICWLGR